MPMKLRRKISKIFLVASQKVARTSMIVKLTWVGDHKIQNCLNLQGGKNKHDGEVDLDDHREELVSEHVDHLAQEHQDPRWKGHLFIYKTNANTNINTKDGNLLGFTVRKLENMGLPSTISTITPC